MSYYTEFIFKAKLRKDTPEEIVELLKGLSAGGNLTGDLEIDHQFFKCGRYYTLFRCVNFDDTMHGSKIHYNGDYWILDIHSEFKNYDDEIEHFVNWITPFVAGRKKKQFIGSYRGEGFKLYTNLYIER